MKKPTRPNPDKRIVRELLQSHDNIRYQQAVSDTAMRFGISESEVLRILRGGDFLVRVSK